ncbi:hypothetical protein FRC02_009810 [Tulasnella sp. 418]|nr:hypothetical protein FRC02_009810 [Tulasnella sp. 418]
MPASHSSVEHLPPPALSSNRATKKTKFENGLKVHWARIKRRMAASGGSPSESQSIGEGADSTASSSVIRKLASTGQYQLSVVPTEDQRDVPLGADEDEIVDEIVVDSHFLMEQGKSTTQPSEHGASPEKSTGTHGTHATEVGSTTNGLDHGSSIFGWDTIYAFYCRLADTLQKFFFPVLPQEGAEPQYQKEVWFTSKSLHLWGTLYLILNWVLVCILIPRNSMIRMDQVFYYGVAPLLIVPLPLMVLFDFPKTRRILWQCWMSIAVWVWPAYILILMQLCGFYNSKEAVLNCKGKEFTGALYYTGSFPPIALFALGQNRLSATISGITLAGIMGANIRNRDTWIRNFLNFVLYIIFLLWIHWRKEVTDRGLFVFRDRLKTQYRATQKAQVSERKAAESKKAFSSYIFHEVRVPLNTALLAVQNMEAAGIFDKESIEFTALEGSLTMMSKVLNDVLDFNRMDSGRFESSQRPYSFHKVLKGILVPLRLATDARELQLVSELDPSIDWVARRALYRAQGYDEDCIQKRLAQPDGSDDEFGIVVGDEHRLRQVVQNLASNAVKFTATGGKITIRTKLIYPSVQETSTASVYGGSANGTSTTATKVDPSVPARLSATQLDLHNAATGSTLVPGIDYIVIRLEVEDTGVGIRRKDMIDNRLFSPYVHTDIGRVQGGKGTGLGLALSRQIVRLSGGRLGVRSQRNVGSTFWLELVLGVGKKVIEKSGMDLKEVEVVKSLSPNSTVAGAFKPPDGEGTTPSTVISSSGRADTDQLPSDGTTYSGASAVQPASALRGLMEHSGQIELLPRRVGDGETTGSVIAPSLVDSGSKLNLAIPPSPSLPKKISSSAVDGSQSSSTTAITERPSHVAIPPNPFSNIGGSRFNEITGFMPEPPGLGSSVPSGSAIASGSPLFDPPLQVLVVDDDALTRKLMTRLLSRLGCQVDVAENGKVALDMILGLKERNPFDTLALSNPSSTGHSEQSGTPSRPAQTPFAQPRHYDIIFLDNQMPVMSGLDLVRKLREIDRDDLVVGITGNAMQDDQEEYLQAGVNHVLTKPVLERSIKTMLIAADERRRDKNSKGDSPTEVEQPPLRQ